jgi:hypothetical protein
MQEHAEFCLDVTDEGPAPSVCPLCGRHFPPEALLVHAADCGGASRPVSPAGQTTVIKQFHPQRRGLRRDLEGAQQLLNQLAAFALVINVYLLPPVWFIEYTLNSLYLERGL